MSGLDEIGCTIRNQAYAFVHGATMRAVLEEFAPLSDWPAFAASWNDLEEDSYLADHGRYRKRRYAVFEIAGGGIERQGHQPHHQHVDYNPLFGGIERWFAPVTPVVGGGPSMQAILGLCHRLFGGLAPSVTRWHAEVHQFRIEAQSGKQGFPTPEGVHRDGVDFVLVLLVTRRNIASGTTTVHGTDGAQLGSFTLTDPLDAALLDYTRVAHGVTPVTPLDPALPAYRDVLVVTFRRIADC